MISPRIGEYPRRRVITLCDWFTHLERYPLGSTLRSDAEAMAAFTEVIRQQAGQLQKLNCQDFYDVGVARRVVVTGLAGGATAVL